MPQLLEVTDVFILRSRVIMSKTHFSRQNSLFQPLDVSPMVAKTSKNNKSKSMRKKRDRGLFARLVGSNFFQSLVGNQTYSPRNKNKTTDSTTDFGTARKQSFPSKLVDLALFAILCLIAPLYRVLRAMSNFLGGRYWLKFSLGVITGISSLTALFLILRKIFA